MEIIWTILEALGLILIVGVGLVGVIIGSVLDVCFVIFCTIRYWIIKGMTAIAKKMSANDETMTTIWNTYLDAVWESDMAYACRFDKMKIPSTEEEP